MRNKVKSTYFNGNQITGRNIIQNETAVQCCEEKIIQICVECPDGGDAFLIALTNNGRIFGSPKIRNPKWELIQCPNFKED